MALMIFRYDEEGWREPAKMLDPALQKLVDEFYVNPGGCLLVACDPETDVKVVGMAGFVRVTPEVCEARHVVVYWGYQGKGVGKSLMDRLVMEARARGYQGIRAEAPESVPALAGFFERVGFKRSPVEMQRAGYVRFEAEI